MELIFLCRVTLYLFKLLVLENGGQSDVGILVQPRIDCMEKTHWGDLGDIVRTHKAKSRM